MASITIHPLLTKRLYASWRDLEIEIEKIADTTEKGNVFEQFCYFYFMYSADLYQISEIYTSKIPGREIPLRIREKYRLAKKDDGVDGVFITYDKTVTAYQAKFRSERRSPSSNELNNFWAEAEYADHRLVIANASNLPVDVIKRKNNLFVLGYLFDALPKDFFVFLNESANEISVNQTTSNRSLQKYTPRDYQEPMINAAVEGFKQHDRGKIIAACGTGKTLVSMWISERIHSKSVLFIAPNLALIRQTIANWTRHCNEKFVYLAVCSDSSVQNDISDEFTISFSEIDIPVTTDPKMVAEFLAHDTTTKKVVFSTYQSMDCVIDAIKIAPGFSFDFALYDEAHRTAGTGSGLFNRALDNNDVPVKKRLFMTATERLVKPWIKDRLEQDDRLVFSMDDYGKYGELFYRLPFGKAIKEHIIADYRVLVAAMTNQELQNLVANNPLVTVKNSKGENLAEDVAAQLLFKAAMIMKATAVTGANKVISFHGSVSVAQAFLRILERLPGIPEHSFLSHVNGSFSASERSDIFRQFESAPFSLISNVKCLIEGVDIPYIDAIMFADPRKSLIDIVQAVGRALRMPYGVMEKTSNIIVPILIDAVSGEAINNDFETLHSIIQALRDQDEMLADWIDKLNLRVVKGGSGSGPEITPKIDVVASKAINIEDFKRNLAIRISEANGKETGATGLGSTLGRNERGSSFTRVFKTIGDYNFVAMRESLIDPTLSFWNLQHLDAVKSRSEIKINNNNVSHTERLGLICTTPNSNRNFKLTSLGKAYIRKQISFEELFTKQLLLFFHQNMYPYRLACQVLAEKNSLNYIEFLYGIYMLRNDIPAQESVEAAIRNIDFIRSELPNVMLTAPGNHETVRLHLNTNLIADFSERDVWTDRTTTGNQFRFFLNHISIFPDCFLIDFGKKEIVSSNATNIQNLLENTNMILETPGWHFGDLV